MSVRADIKGRTELEIYKKRVNDWHETVASWPYADQCFSFRADIETHHFCHYISRQCPASEKPELCEGGWALNSSDRVYERDGDTFRQSSCGGVFVRWSATREQWGDVL